MRYSLAMARMILRFQFCLLFMIVLSSLLLAADAPQPDVVTFVNGEQMSGKLVKVADGKVFFHSDMVGDVSFEWAKVKDLKTAQKFAVLPKGAKLAKKNPDHIPEGTLSVTDGTIAVASTTVPAAQTPYVVDQASFDKQMQQRSSFLSGWTGAITAGVSLVEATQKNQNFTTGIALVRKNPGVDWLRTTSRTVFDFTDSYGKVTQPGTPTVKTSIYHADGEQDEYVSDRLYVLGHAAFDHNFSQGLDLQQLYGGGLGYTLLKDKVQSLDLRADMHYEKQQFADSANNQNLIGSEFAEAYIRKLAHAMVLTQGILLDPAWNNTHAYSAQGTLGLAAPLSKSFSLSVNLLDGYLNNPPPGFKKNSLQFTTGLTYAIK